MGDPLQEGGGGCAERAVGKAAGTGAGVAAGTAVRRGFQAGRGNYTNAAEPVGRCKLKGAPKHWQVGGCWEALEAPGK